MSGQPGSEDASTGPAPGGQAEQRRLRKRRAKRIRVLAGVVGFWLAMGVALYVVDWGSGEDGGSPYAGGDWEDIRNAPLEDRGGAGIVWAEDRLVVWSGFDTATADGPQPRRFTDGVTWSGSGEWVEMAPPPRDLALAVGGFAVWTGDEAVFGPVVTADPDAVPEEESPGLLAYDPSTDDWREIQLSAAADDQEPFASLGVGGPDAGYAASVAGDSSLLVHRRSAPDSPFAETDDGGALVVDVGSGETLTLPPTPQEAAVEAAGEVEGSDAETDAHGRMRLAVADGHAVALVEPGLSAWSLDLTDPLGEWQRSDAPDAVLDPDGAEADTDTGTDAVDDGSGAGAAWATTGEEPLLGAGDEVLLLGGDVQLAYAPGADAWRAPSDAPEEERDTGFVWTGDAALSAGLVYHPEDDRWAATERLPIHEDDAVARPYVGWTDDVMVVFGGQRLTECAPGEECDRPLEPSTLDGWVHLTRG